MTTTISDAHDVLLVNEHRKKLTDQFKKMKDIYHDLKVSYSDKSFSEIMVIGSVTITVNYYKFFRNKNGQVLCPSIKIDKASFDMGTKFFDLLLDRAHSLKEIYNISSKYKE